MQLCWDGTAEQVSPVATRNGSYTSYQQSQLLMLTLPSGRSLKHQAPNPAECTESFLL